MRGMVAFVSIIFMLVFLVAAVTFMMATEINLTAFLGASLVAFLYLLAAMGTYASPRIPYSIYAITTVLFLFTGIFYIVFQGFDIAPVLFYVAIVAVNVGLFSLSGRLLQDFLQAEKAKTDE